MKYSEKCIKHESPGCGVWVLDTGKSYDVMVVGLTHSTTDSSYARTDDGLSIAIARCDYLHRRNVVKINS